MPIKPYKGQMVEEDFDEYDSVDSGVEDIAPLDDEFAEDHEESEDDDSEDAEFGGGGGTNDAPIGTTWKGSDDDIVPLHAPVKPQTSASKTPPKKYNGGQSAAYGFGHGATFGLLDEAGAVMDGLFGDYAGDGERTSIWEGLAQGKGIGDVYRENRDKNRAILQQAHQDNPEAYLAGDIGSVVVPGLGWAGAAAKANKARTAVELAKQGGKIGAVQGAARGYGDGEDLVDSLLGSLKGGAIGGALGGAVGAGSKALDKIGDAGAWAADKVMGGYERIGDAGDGLMRGLFRGHNPVANVMDKIIGTADDVAAKHPVVAPVRQVLGNRSQIAGRSTAVGAHPAAIAPEVAARAAQMAGRVGGRVARDPRAAMASTRALSEVESNRRDKVSIAVQDPERVIELAKGTPFELPLRNAAKKGRQAFLAQLHVMRTHPDFRKLVESKVR